MANKNTGRSVRRYRSVRAYPKFFREEDINLQISPSVIPDYGVLFCPFRFEGFSVFGCDIFMMPRGTFIRIFFWLAFLLCVGCGSSRVSLERNEDPTKSVSSPSVDLRKAVLPPPSLSLCSPVKTGFKETEGFYDVTYDNKILTEDLTLRGRVLIKGVLTIACQATLIIEPGTVISFVAGSDGRDEGVLLVQGRITALGTADKQIFFKCASSKAAGSWRGIILLGSEKNNVFEHCRVEGACVGLDVVFSTISLRNTSFSGCGTGMRSQGSLVQSEGGGVSGSQVGYSLLDCEAYVMNGTFVENNQGLFVLRGSLSIRGGSFSKNSHRGLATVDSKIAVAGAVFADNGSGLVLTGSEGSVENSSIVENREYGIQLLRSRIKIVNNLIYMNTGVGIIFHTGASAAWNNNISLNGLYDLYNAGSEEFRAIGNWWGSLSENGRGRKIFDKAADPNRGSVLTFPELASPPSDFP